MHIYSRLFSSYSDGCCSLLRHFSNFDLVRQFSVFLFGTLLRSFSERFHASKFDLFGFSTPFEQQNEKQWGGTIQSPTDRATKLCTAVVTATQTPRGRLCTDPQTHFLGRLLLGVQSLTLLSIPQDASMGRWGCDATQLTMSRSALREVTKRPVCVHHKQTTSSSLVSMHTLWVKSFVLVPRNLV